MPRFVVFGPPAVNESPAGWSLDGSHGGKVFAFDTGPANCLMDEAVTRFAGLDYDLEGRYAAAGSVDERVLKRWLEHPYLRLPPPKTTGRELFELDEFLALETDLEGVASRQRRWEPGGMAISETETADLLATLCAFSAESIAAAYRDFIIPLGLDEILLAGGGAHNPTLVAKLRERLSLPVRTFAELGYDARDREALAFAVMAYCGFHGVPNILPSATGAKRPVVAGKIVHLRPREQPVSYPSGAGS